MANIYGSCTGSSRDSYNVWLAVTENSTSVSGNTSNITAELKLKRNDGYSSSAYNLNTNDNSASLSVGGSVRDSGSLKIDTRNSAVVTLASWTGNVTHNADGSLNLSVSGSFSMGTSGLSGGSVSGTFKCTDIPRASTLSLSVSVVNPGGDVTATVSAAAGSFSHKIKYAIGAKSVVQTLSAGVSTKLFTVSKTWANELTNSAKGVIAVTLYTYSGTKVVGSKTYSLNLVIPNTAEYKPDFTLSVTRNDNGVPSSFDVYVQGKSTVKIDVTDVSCKYGASVYSKSAKAFDVTKSSLPAVFNITKSGIGITVSATVKDSRGYYTTKTASIDVYEYSEPSVAIKTLYRCLADGTKSDSGTYFKVDYAGSVSAVNNKNIAIVKVKYKTASGEYCEPVVAGLSPFVFGGGNILNTVSYKVCLSVSDLITTTENSATRSIASSDIPFNIRKGGKGAAFGCYAEADNELAIAYDLNVKGVIKYTDLDDKLSFATNLVSDSNYTVRYFKCLGIVFARIKVVTASQIAANTTVTLGTLSANFPPVANVLSVMSPSVNGIKAFISYLGELDINSEAVIPANTKIYINGYWFNSDEAEVN